MFIWSREAFISALGLSLLHSLWQGVVIGGLGLVLNARLRRLTPSGRYSIFCLLLLTFFAAWLCSLGSLYVAERRLASSSSPPLSASLPATLAPFTVQTEEAFSAQGWRAVLPFFAAFWLAGVAALSLRHLGGIVTLRRLRPPRHNALSPRMAGAGEDACGPFRPEQKTRRASLFRN